jgi:hypothetical protein
MDSRRWKSDSRSYVPLNRTILRITVAMITRSSLPLLLLVYLCLVSFVFASGTWLWSCKAYRHSPKRLIVIDHLAPTSFCKCTCFSNSTIIPLEPSDSGSSTFSSALFRRDDNRDGADPENDKVKYRALNCNDCNRRFCLDYHLPMCKEAKEEDVFTTCFRESTRSRRL